MPKLVWVAWMSRWNMPSPTHAYATGVFSDIEKAREAGMAEEHMRGGKYEFQHCPTWVDMEDDRGSSPLPPLVCVEPGTKIWVAWVLAHKRCHFVGAFSSREKAEETGHVFYPGWRVEVCDFAVDEVDEEE